MQTRDRLCALLILLLTSLQGAPVRAGEFHDTSPMTVDLHAHVFMREGIGAIFGQGFFGPITARDWSALFDNQINPEALERSRNRIVVVSLYVHPLLKWLPRQAIRRQIGQAERFVAMHPNWVIARDPAQAREAVAAGKRVLVLGLERASWVLEDERDLEEFVDRLGVRVVTPLHLIDDENGGVSLEPSWKIITSPLAWLEALFHPQYEEGALENPNGLTDHGRQLIAALMKRKVWIDLAHASERSQREAIAMLEAADQPLLYTHVSLRHHLGAERALSREGLAAVARTHGIVGLLPSEEMLEHTAIDPAYCPPGCHCEGGVPAFATQYAELASALGADHVMIGSDFNGFLNHLRPACATGTELDRPQGLYNIGQTHILWDAITNLGAPVPSPRGQMVDAFLSAWERVVR